MAMKAREQIRTPRASLELGQKEANAFKKKKDAVIQGLDELCEGKGCSEYE